MLKWGSVVAAAMLMACGEGDNAPPLISDVPDQVAVVGQRLEVLISGSDPDGDALRYGYEAPIVSLVPGSATISTNAAGQGVFAFTPLASQIGAHAIDFIVSDGKSERVTTANLEVRSASGSDQAPVFVRPQYSGGVLDASVETCISVELAVQDFDSTEVEIAVEPALPGTQLLPGPDGLSATWTWCPTGASVLSSQQHFTFIADDGESVPVEKRFSVVIRGGECDAQVLAIEHVPDDVRGVQDVLITFAIDGPVSGDPSVAYGTIDPGGPENIDQLDLAPVEASSAGSYRAVIPSPVAAPGSPAEATLYYIISASTPTQCTVDRPVDDAFEIRVRAEGGAGSGACAPCSHDAQCGDANDLCLGKAAGDASYCGASCNDDGDCPEDMVCPPAPLTSVDGQAARQCVPQLGTCDTGCSADAYEPNDGVEQAFLRPRLVPGSYGSLSLCPDDDDWYVVELDEPASIRLDLVGEGSNDLDLVLTDDGGIILDAGVEPGGTEEITSICLDAGTYLVRVHSLFTDATDYSLNLGVDPQGC